MSGAPGTAGGIAAHEHVECGDCVVRRGHEHCAVCHLPRATHALPQVRFVEREQLARGAEYDEFGRVWRVVLWAPLGEVA